ncbi:MAG: glutathione S-transferase family protein [Actinomycetota bacterium]
MSADESLPVLWQLRFSHFNEKGRWALDYKGLPHRRRSVAAGSHPIRSRRLGGTGTLPILVIDGEVIGDSTDIIATLEQRRPDPPLYPDNEIDREAALELEEHFDSGLGPGLRSAVFHAILPFRKVTVPVTTQGLPAQHRVISTAIYPLIRVGATRSLGADDEGARRGREQTVEALDRIETELNGRDYLVGDRFSVADLTAAALLFPLVCPPEFPYEMPAPWPDEWEEFRRSLAGRPGYQWAEEMYRRHRGSSAAVGEEG